MPQQAAHRCTKCRALVRGACPTCQRPWAQRPASWPGNASDPRWRRVRATRLRLDPLCDWCGEKATTADHLDGTDYSNDTGKGASWLNLATTRSLCAPCHQRRTSAQGGRAKRFST